MKFCPKCKVPWESEQEIPYDLFDTGLYGTLEECKKVAEKYGWLEDNSKRFGINHYYSKPWFGDGRWLQCEKCGTKFTLNGREIK